MRLRKEQEAVPGDYRSGCVSGLYSWFRFRTTLAEVIVSPFSIEATTSCPSITRPKTVCPLGGGVRVEVGRRQVRDEELRPAGVLAGVGHAQASHEVHPGVRLVALALDVVARAARSRRLGAARTAVGAAPWAMNCGITRWNWRPS